MPKTGAAQVRQQRTAYGADQYRSRRNHRQEPPAEKANINRVTGETLTIVVSHIRANTSFNRQAGLLIARACFSGVSTNSEMTHRNQFARNRNKLPEQRTSSNPRFAPNAPFENERGMDYH